MASGESPRPKRRERDRDRDHDRRRHRSHTAQRKSRTTASSSSASQPHSKGLSADSLAKLNNLNERSPRYRDPEYIEERSPGHRDSEIRPERTRRKRPREVIDERVVIETETRRRHQHRKRRRRDVSGALLEEGDSRTLRGLRGGELDEKHYERFDDYDQDVQNKKKKRIWIGAGIVILLLAILIPVAVVVSKKNSTSNSSTGATTSSGAASNADVPTADRNTQMDPSIWLDTTDFNTTYTNTTVGGLPIIGLFTAWDDSAQANPNVPALNQAWGSYATRPARGVNLGGWLSLEPFIAPSLFQYDSKMGIIDEYTLSSHLGPAATLSTLEQHYSTFVTEQDFIDIANAGLDHVRISYSYWAVVTYPGDPYLFRTSWRYLLRAIEWARKHGLRINLDLHGVPGSQNGWNHSGRQGNIGWLNGTDGATNAQRSLDIHNQLSQFFAQDRYKNIIAFYGLVNEPKMTTLPANSVETWSASAFQIVRQNNITAYIVIGDGFRGLANWQGQLQGYSGLVLDVHQYEIFNVGQIVYNHTTKVNYACAGWTQQAQQSSNTATGFGPTLFAEWSQADTDCATWLNNVNVGARWTGTYNTGNPLTQVLSPTCAAASGCECSDANAPTSAYSAAYKQFLLTFAEAQMTSFEYGWGWFYWTWKTESAPQWSYQAGLAAGVLPAKAYSRSWNCSMAVPAFAGLPETY